MPQYRPIVQKPGYCVFVEMFTRFDGVICLRRGFWAEDLAVLAGDRLVSLQDNSPVFYRQNGLSEWYKLNAGEELPTEGSLQLGEVGIGHRGEREPSICSIPIRVKH